MPGPMVPCDKSVNYRQVQQDAKMHVSIGHFMVFHQNLIFVIFFIQIYA